MLVTAAELSRRSPPAAWEAWFLVAIFREGPVRWCKVQLFTGGRRPGFHCLSAVEGMDGAGERLILIGRENEVIVDRRPITYVDASRSGWDVRARDTSWHGGLDENDLATDRLSARTRATDVLWWANLPPALSYFSAFGASDITIDGVRRTGQALLEHAWGGEVPFDPRRFAPRRWQWDVLAFEDGTTCAGLSVEAGPIAIPLRSGGRTPGGPFEVGRGLRVRVDHVDERGGRKIPIRWRGTMKLPRGDVEYVATARTDVAAVVPRGGFLGFSFEGTIGRRRVSGTGFCEYAF